ncbi:hypothetical protein LR48_Vigan247s000300 [Vigna angularis]|uniref:CCHC-type domain-containing protein n=1 Tax=Phaseolus angularis TaxID=3914 RepID=A0A0L9T6Q6_PHAAN|nr:hypothetical protein LR48_Vigan247s000300 [Vigna angularis]
MAGAKRCKVQLRMGNLQASTFQQLEREEHSRLEEACTSRTSKEKESNGEKKTHRLVQNCQANNESCTVKNIGTGKGKKIASSNTVQCYECGKEGHIKPECPNLKVKQRTSRRFPQDKSRKQKTAYIAWENSYTDSSSHEDCDREEESNICFMAGLVKDDYGSDEEFENEPIEVKYDMLLDAFQEIHAKAMRLQYKVNRLNCDRRDYEHKFVGR